MGDLKKTMRDMGAKARGAARQIATTSTPQKNDALQKAADALRQNADAILTANRKDMKQAEAEGVNKARLDRIMLDEARLQGVAQAVEAICDLPDPVGASMARW